MGDEKAAYRAVQIRNTDSLRVWMIELIKIGLQVETAEIIRMHVGDEFSQAIILADRRNRAYIGWYSSPLMSQAGFGDTIRRICTDYDTQVITGDFNARHPRWCTSHDRFKRGARLLQLIHELPQLVVHAPAKPTFQDTRYRETGSIRSRTVDLLISRVPVPRIDIIRGYIDLCSDHHPITFTLGASIERVDTRRWVSKTLLQS